MDKGTARRTDLYVSFAGVDISDDIRRYLISASYTDNEADEADDFQMSLEDREDTWLGGWLDSAVKGTNVSAKIIRRNWKGDGLDDELNCGEFQIDDVSASGPPSTINIRCTSLPFLPQMRQTVKNKAWVNYSLQAIAEEMAVVCGLSLIYEAPNPFYNRVEQSRTSDIEFLKRLCHDAGISIKSTGSDLVLFDQKVYEAAPPVRTIVKGDGTYTDYKLNTGQANVQYAACTVSYNHPDFGLLTAAAYAEDYDEENKNNQLLNLIEHVNSVGEAQAMATARLRLHNKFEKTGSVTFPGEPGFAAGLTVQLERFGLWSGKYMLNSVSHSVGGSGYQTSIDLRNVLGGY
jgi:phage protein D